MAAWVLAVAGPGLLTLAALPLRSSLVLGGFLFSALLVVIAVAVLGGVWPALAGVVLGVLARVVFFAPPFESHGVDLQPNLVSLAGAPIIVSGRPWGVMIAGSIDERPLPPDAESVSSHSRSWWRPRSPTPRTSWS